MVIPDSAHGRLPALGVGDILSPTGGAPSGTVDTVRSSHGTVGIHIRGNHCGTLGAKTMGDGMTETGIGSGPRYQTNFIVQQSHIFPLLITITA